MRQANKPSDRGKRANGALAADVSGEFVDDGFVANLKVTDRNFWADQEDEKIPAWIEAIEAIDKRREVDALVRGLKSDRELSKRARFYLADLIERQLGNKRGRPLTPAYDRTWTVAQLELARDDVGHLAKMPIRSDGFRDRLERLGMSDDDVRETVRKHSKTDNDLVGRPWVLISTEN